MQSHEFTLILSVEDVTDDQCNALYEAGCDDGTVSTSERVTRIENTRPAGNGEADPEPVQKSDPTDDSKPEFWAGVL